MEAVGKVRERCWRYNWVIDLDIKGFFNNLDHDLLKLALEKHIPEKWEILYIVRWLKALVQQPDRRLIKQVKGTPRGGVISPLLENLYLHYAMDEWLRIKYPHTPFERYADDRAQRMREAPD